MRAAAEAGARSGEETQAKVDKEMKALTRMSDTPLPVVRSHRPQIIEKGTSLPAGRVVPVAHGVLFREDSMSGQIKLQVEMQETREIFMNGVELRAMAYVVPWLALERFEGSREQLDRSMAGLPKIAGGAVVPFIETAVAGAHGSNLIHKYLGLHTQPGDEYNTMIVEAYNIIDKYRAKNRSKDLSHRTRLQTDLAAAYWDHAKFSAIVPDFDQEAMHAEVQLTVQPGSLPVKGIGVSTVQVGSGVDQVVRETNNELPTYDVWTTASDAAAGQNVFIEGQTGGGGEFIPRIYAEMQANGITVSLANIDKAKKMKAFAELRKRYDGHDDEYIIDMLMNGLSIPDQHLKNPILVGEGKTTFSQLKRYATDANNLDVSAVSGGAEVTLRVRCPQISVGGILLVVVEALPKQLFERQKDPLLYMNNERYQNGELKCLPSYVRDVLDEEKVDVVYNKDIDVSHATPTSVFGYAPLHWEWAQWPATMGGDLFRPTVNTTVDTLRQRIWAVETVNPVLSEDFYRAREAPHLKGFLDETKDPFQAVVLGKLGFNGLTQFGPLLIEASDNWEKVSEMAPVLDEQIARD